MVRDPQFWKRFSVAVHQDDMEKQEMASADLKHSYVNSTCSTLFSPLASPTSQSPLSHAIPPMSQISSLRSSLAFSAPQSPRNSWQRPRSTPAPKRPKSKLQKTPSTKPLLRPSISSPPPSYHPENEKGTILSPPQSPFLPILTPSSPSRSFFRTPNLSTFSLSGRPQSRFNFTTTITANASDRDSWLTRQKKKERHRTWLCWAFWIVFLLLIAGIVVTVLMLKAHGII